MGLISLAFLPLGDATRLSITGAFCETALTRRAPECIGTRMSSSEHAQAESISVRLPPAMAAQLDRVMARDGYMHRSECVRRLLAEALLRKVGDQRQMSG
jgi:hypothetical protein